MITLVKHMLITTALVLSSFPGFSQEATPAPFEDKITAVSPDKKFAMRIRHDQGIKETANIDSACIQSIDLVSLPAKEVVATLLPEDEIGMNFSGLRLVWSKDSQWCAFYYAFPRVGYTTVLRRDGDQFAQVGKPEDLMTEVKGDVRNEYIKPLRWTKPGILVLKQFSILRGDDGPSDSRIQFTATYDEKSGVFKVITPKESK